MSAALTTALVGYGFAGRDIHGPLLAGTRGLDVTDIVTANPERARAAHAEFPDATIHPSLEALFDAARPDLAVIASPTGAHHQNALEAIGRGIPVVIDKPMAVTADQGREVLSEARRADVPLTIFQNRRWDTAHLTLRDVVRRGTVGRPLRYEARFERWRPQPKHRWREDLPGDQGGGLMLDLQSHLVDGALNIFGPVTSVYAETAAVTTVADDVTFLALRHASGLTSHLGATSLAAAPGPRIRLLGTEACYLVDAVDGEPAETGTGAFPDPSGQFRGWILRGREREPVEAAPGTWQHFYEAVVAWLRDGAPAPVEPADAVAVLDVLDAARRSAADGVTVSLSA